MLDLVHALQTGSMSLWLFIPSAILLGALHGLEPGHSKTMMAAFILAIRGTIAQAVLLGLSAAISHSLIIWLLAALALHFGNQWNVESVEPYLQIGSAFSILALATWMFLRTRREIAEAHAHYREHSSEHDHEHGEHTHNHHHHHDESVLVPAGHGSVQLSIFEKDTPPVFRLAFIGEKRTASDFALETVRLDGSKQTFAFGAKDGCFESTDEIPEPHEFDVLLTLNDSASKQVVRIEFREGKAPRIEGDAGEYQDAHERAHANEIAQRFAGRKLTTSQIVIFGITGGLMPCPAAFSVLLICLQIKRIALGFTLVASFSFGLALTMVATGALAAWSVHHAQRKFRGFGEVMRRAPYISCIVLVIIASYMAWQGWHTLSHS